MNDSPFSRFSDHEVREMLRDADLSDVLSDANVAQLGLERLRTQRERVIAAYHQMPDVDAIFAALRREVPKSSIRSYLCRATDAGTIGTDWRLRRRRRRKSFEARP